MSGFGSWLRSLFYGQQPKQYEVGEDGWLTGPRVVRVPTARTSGPLRSVVPLGVVWHWTATGNGTAKTIANAWRTRPTGDQHVGSAHLIIERDGTVYALAPFSAGCWHCIAGRIQGVKINHCTIGIEVVAVGRVAKKLDGYFRGWAKKLGVGYGPAVETSEVIQHRGRHYHWFSPAQQDAIRGIHAAILRRYPTMERNLSATDHKQWDPERKEDCGTPWDDFRKEIEK